MEVTKAMFSEKKTPKKVLRRLAAGNVRKSAEDYLIYFFTLTFAVALFYTFNSIQEQFAALNLPDTYNFLSAAESAMMGCSVLVSLIVGFLILYANHFMMKRRKREFAIYGILGMEQSDIGGMMTRETVRIGGISLLCGLPLGVAVSQLLALVTTRLAYGNVENYTFIFSVKAMGLAVCFFALTFAAVHVFRLIELKRAKLIDLLQADRKNEVVPERSRAGVLFGALALLLIALGYGTIFCWQDVDLFKAAAVSGALVSFGTVLFFLSASAVLLGALKRRKNYYYRGLNLFVVSQLGSRMRRDGLSLAIVCVLMYLSVSVMGGGTGLGQSFIKEKNRMAPYDLSVIYYFDGFGENDEAMRRGRIAEELARRDTGLSGYLEKTAEILFYVEPGLTMRDVFGKYEGPARPGRQLYEDDPLLMVGVDDYNHIRALMGLVPISLGEAEFAISYNEPEAEHALMSYVNNVADGAPEDGMPVDGEPEDGAPEDRAPEKTLEIAGTRLTLKADGLNKMTIYNRNVFLDIGTVIVPQRVAEQSQPYMRIMDAMLSEGGESAYEAVQRSQVLMGADGFLFQSREDLFIEFLSNQLMVSYLGIYLGITFLVTAGAVLALQQLTQAADNERRYALLSKLGAGEGAMRKALRAQLGVYFGLPILVAAVHSGVTMYGIYRDIPYLSAQNIAQNILFAAGLAAVIYSVYFLTTYTGCKRILKL